MRGVPLDSTYTDPSVHRRWWDVYHGDRSQAAADDAVYDYLFEKLRPGSRWLDAGCGNGEHAVRLAMRNCQVTGVDISEIALEKARRSAAQADEHIQFFQSSLENLTEPVNVDNVHCRGVLMHIPEWRSAVRNLSRYVRPGGYFVVFESNAASLEYLMVRLARRIFSRKSSLARTDAGMEFWAENNGHPFLVRMFDLRALIGEFARQGLTLQMRRSLFLIDLNRVPAAIRKPFRLLNRMWFQWNGPFASGVILVFQKTGTAE